MTQLRSYTTIEQSKKLAEFLPIESADQTWERIAIAGANLDVPEELQYRHNGDRPYLYYSGIGIPCWSLAALLSVINNIKGWYPGIDAQVEDNKWQICMFSRETGSDTDLSSMDEELVDVCYEVIVKLHEQNLI